MPEQNQQKGIKSDRPLAFWDIESVPNIFEFGVYQENIKNADGKPYNRLIFYYLFDDIELTPDLEKDINNEIFRKNKQLKPESTQIIYLNLKDENVNKMLVNIFCVDDKPAFGKPEENQFRTIAAPHSDIDADISYPYMIGYNSANFDNTCMAAYFNETWGFVPNQKPKFMPTTAEFMRRFCTIMFETHKNDMINTLNETEKRIYDNTMRSGLFLDAGKINDKVYKMALKRIMGMMGMDIFEDNSVKGDKPIKTRKEITKLFAYNASDCIKLAKLFEHPAYKAQFELKKGLLKSYPDLIYNAKDEVRINRLKIDDTSAKFAQRVLCPDGFLSDIRAVSFEYPKGSGRNILKETREWATEKFKNTPEILEKYIYPIFDWYGSIEGHNFDDSDHYRQTYQLDGLPAEDIKNFKWPCTAIPYFNADGSFSRTYVNFGIGGIHGAEYNQDLYLKDLEAEKAQNKIIDDFRSKFSDDDIRNAKSVIILNGDKHKLSEFVTKRKDGSLKFKYAKPVQLFDVDSKSGTWKLNKRYTWCSDDEVDHEDFTSYYPCLLMNLKAYENKALGEDRYVQQFNNKGKYGKLMKDKSLDAEIRSFYSTLREGTKLILNSASGASDTAYDNNIRMNNVIITMRIIGQLFTWRIGQAQTIEGFKITSTNTDGLYAVCNDKTRARCREILERESATIGVGIEPEEMRLISKDANNRIEISLKGELLGASGGDTACHKGPTPTKALSHPAIIDTLLVKYLMQYGVNEKFDTIKAGQILNDMKNTEDPYHLLLLYQHIINSSEGSVRYIFGEIDGKTLTFQHNNRIFAVKTNAAHLYMANGNNIYEGHDKLADKILREYGVNPDNYKNTRVIKISRISSEQNMFIYNEDLFELPETTARSLIANLDDGFYIQLLEEAYKNWCNINIKSDDDNDDAA